MSRGTVDIEYVFDARQMMVRVGDTVAYPGMPFPNRRYENGDGELVMVFRSGSLRTSKVRRIWGDEYGGFAEAGGTIYVQLEDGHIATGDSENGGLDFLKLEQEWVYDERVGCVAVYRGPKRECLSGAWHPDTMLFYRHGKQVDGAWTVDEEDIAEAKRTFKYLTGSEP